MYNMTLTISTVAPVGDPNVGNRQMMITIPDGVREGQVLTVAAPDGTMVQITVQGNHRPGDQVIIKY